MKKVKRGITHKDSWETILRANSLQLNTKLSHALIKYYYTYS